jgi:hypothetical protein
MKWVDVEFPVKKGTKVVMQRPKTCEGFTYHTFGHKTVVACYHRRVARMDFLSEIDYESEPHFIKHEGVYLFGGVFGRNASEQRINSKLFCLPIG